MNADVALHQIGAVADRTGLSLRTIRHYDEVGLVVPSGRSAGGFRLYTDADISRLQEIKVMKPLGFSLDETVAILELRAEVRTGSIGPAGLERLAQFAARAAQRVEALADQLGRARSFSATLHDEVARADRGATTGPTSGS